MKYLKYTAETGKPNGPTIPFQKPSVSPIFNGFHRAQLPHSASLQVQRSYSSQNGMYPIVLRFVGKLSGPYHIAE